MPNRRPGRDVVIGFLETHGRAETGLAEGLSGATRRVIYRGAVIEEMDLPAILRGRRLCLIDELAHTNAPGSTRQALRGRRGRAGCRHRRALDPERPAPGVAQRPRRRADRRGVRETIPTGSWRAPTRSCSIDLTPEALLDRLRAGKIYPPRAHRCGAQQLLPDREPLGAARGRPAPGRRGGRRQAPTTEVAARARRASPPDAPQAVGERLLALVEPDPCSPAARPPGLALGPAPRRRPRPALGAQPGSARTRRRSARNRTGPARLVLGAKLLDEESDDVAPAVADVAERRGSTYILLGRSAAPRAGSPAGAAPAAADGAPAGVDVRIVADRAVRQTARPGSPSPASWARGLVGSPPPACCSVSAPASGCPPQAPLRARPPPPPVRRILLPFTAS